MMMLMIVTMTRIVCQAKAEVAHAGSSYYSCYCCEGSSLSLVTCTPTGMRLAVCDLVKYFCLHQRCFTQGGVLG